MQMHQSPCEAQPNRKPAQSASGRSCLDVLESGYEKGSRPRWTMAQELRLVIATIDVFYGSGKDTTVIPSPAALGVG